jgi:hypothetical protein
MRDLGLFTLRWQESSAHSGSWGSGSGTTDLFPTRPQLISYMRGDLDSGLYHEASFVLGRGLRTG